MTIRADHQNRSACYIQKHAHELGLADDHPIRRIANELHLDYRRAPNSLKELLSISEDEISWLHWIKHHHVHGVRTEKQKVSSTVVFIIDALVPDKAYWDTVIDERGQNGMAE